MSFTGACSSTICMLAPTRPNSTTGHQLRIKRASEVPPLVESEGFSPVCFSIAAQTCPVKASGVVRKASALQGSKRSS